MHTYSSSIINMMLKTSKHHTKKTQFVMIVQVSGSKKEKHLVLRNTNSHLTWTAFKQGLHDKHSLMEATL